MLRALRAGEVNALVAEGDAGPQLVTLQVLDAEQNRFRSEMLAQVSDAVIAVDIEERVTFLNAAAEHQYGVRAGDVLGRNIAEIFTPHWPSPEAEAGMRTALSERGAWRGELIHCRPDGSEMHVETSASALRDSSSAITGLVASIRDIAKRHQAEAAVRQNTALFSTIIDQAPGGVYVVDAQFRVAKMNAESLPFFASAAPLIGRDFDEALEIVWGPEVGPQIATIFRHTLATGERYVSPRFSEQRHDLGVEQSFEWETRRITLPDGQHGVVCYFQDVTVRERAAAALRSEVTERTRAEAALAQNAALFAKIIEQAPGGVYVMDSQLRVREVNTEALPVFASVLPVIGRELGEVMEAIWGPELGRECTAIFRRTLETGERYVSPRFDHLRHDIGVEQVYDWETQRLTLPDGQLGVVCYFQDVTARERAAEALRVSEEHYRVLVTASSAAVYRMSADWSEILHLNGQGFVADTTPPSVNWVEEYLYPEDQPQVLAAIREAILTKGHFEMEHRVRRVDGSVGWTSSHAIPLLNAKGEIIEWFGAASDITARKQAEQARHELERNYEALAVASSEIAYRMSADWSMILSLNGRQLALSADKPLATWEWLDQNTPREEHPRVRQAISDAIAGKTLFELEHRVRRPDGSIGWALSRAVPILNEHGEVITWFGAASDITERKATEEALRESEERLRKAISVENVGVLFFKLDGHMLDANGSLERMSGYTADELRRITDWAQLTPPEFMDVTRRAAAELAERGVTAPYEKQWIRKDGSRFWGLFSPTRLSGSGSESECVEFTIDITETKRAEEHVRLHRQLLETMVNNLPSAVALVRGSDLTFQLFNPAYQAISPGKQIVGKTIPEVWAETMPLIVQRCRHVLETGEPFKAVDERYEIRRDSDGPLETAYFTWSMRTVNLPDEVQPGLLLTIRETTARKEVELALSEKSARYKALFDSIDQGFCIIEVLFEENRPKDYRFLEVNPAFEKHSGLKEAQGKWVRDLVPGHEEHWLEIYGKIVLTGEPARFEQHGQALGRWFDVYAFPVGEHHENRVAILFTNITERKKSHEAVSRLAAIVESSHDALIGEDLDGIITSWNPGAEQIFGYSADEIVGTSLLRLIPEARQDEEHALQRKIAAGERGGTIEGIRRARDGREFDASITVSPLKNAAGKVIGTSRIVRDITDRKRTEETLRESEGRLGGILRQSPAGIVQTDAAGCMTLVNPRWCEMLGQPEAELLGRNMLEITHPSFVAETATAFGRLAAGGADFEIEKAYCRKDGSVLRAQSNVAAIRTPTGEFLGLIAVVLDISERFHRRGVASARRRTFRNRSPQGRVPGDARP